MGKASKRKGKAGEAEAEAVLIDLNWDAQRTSLLQARGDDAADIEAWCPSQRSEDGTEWGEMIPHMVEVKFKKSGFTPVYSALGQAIEAATDGETPCVLFRQTDTSRKREWIIAMRVSDYTKNVGQE